MRLFLVAVILLVIFIIGLYCANQIKHIWKPSELHKDHESDIRRRNLEEMYVEIWLRDDPGSENLLRSIEERLPPERIVELRQKAKSK